MAAQLAAFLAFFGGMCLGTGIGLYLANFLHRRRGDHVLTAADVRALEDIRRKLDSLGQKE